MITKNNKNLLFLAYFYPPLGGPAVQRPCKTVKYLAQAGWNVDVVTIADIVYHSTDETLLKECNHRKAIRTASFDLMYLLNKIKRIFGTNTEKLYFQSNDAKKQLIKKLFPIDDKIGWLPYAIKAGKQALLTDKYKAVMVTCGPFSSSLAAGYLAKLAKIPLIIDYRDHWTLNNTVKQPKGIVFKMLRNLERRQLKAASLVLAATDHIRIDLINEFGANLTDKIMPYFNGWDEADFSGMDTKRKPDNKILISYIGTLYGERSLRYYLKAMQEVIVLQPGIDIELQMVGNFYPETIAEVEQSGIKDKVRFIGQQPHAEAIQIMLDSDILLLVIGGAKNNWILTGKLFEYLRCQKPILALTAPDSDAANIMRECGQQAICDIIDSDSIMDTLLDLIASIKQGSASYSIPYNYERSMQVKALAERISCL
jgi:glycosyltransferase involved in cell wall biosynthesis